MEKTRISPNKPSPHSSAIIKENVPVGTKQALADPLSDRYIQDLLSKKQFKEADLLLQKRLSQQPGSPDVHYLIGVMHYFQGSVGKSVENLKKALSIDPRHTDAAICLSVLLNDIGKYDDAKKIFEQANQSVTHSQSAGNLEIDKKFAVKHLELADLYFRYRRYDESIEEYSKAIRLDPSALEHRIRRAKAYAKKGFLTRSIQELQQLKREHPYYIPGRIQLGLLHYSQGNILDAELEWEGTIDIDPNHREALAYLQMAKKSRTSTDQSRNLL
jgi:tetratricopeptide (TPR) repeat protein